MMTRTRSIFKIFCFLFLFMGLSPAHAQTIIRDTEIENTLKEWSAPLLKNAGVGEVNIVLVQSPQINAFVAGGKNIFIYTGLIDKSTSADEVLGVLAHEIGHIAGGHLISTRAAAERASYESILGAVLGIGTAVITGNGGAAQAVISGSQTMAQRSFLAHSRVNEASADQFAFSALSGANLSGDGLVSFFEKLSSEELLPTSGQSEYVRTHPLTRDRIEAVKSLVSTSPLKDKSVPEKWKEQHARMKAKLLGFIAPQQVAWAYDDHNTSIAARYARAIAAYRQSDVAGALRQMDGLLQDEPQNPYFHELKGQMLFEFGRVEDSIAPIRKSVEILPGAALLHIALAHSLIESGDNPARLKEAITHLKRALEGDEHTAMPHRLLATAYGRLGQEDLARLELAEEAVLQMKLDYAKSQVEGVMGNLRKGSPEDIKARDILARVETLKRQNPDLKDEGEDESPNRRRLRHYQ